MPSSHSCHGVRADQAKGFGVSSGDIEERKNKLRRRDTARQIWVGGVARLSRKGKAGRQIFLTGAVVCFLTMGALAQAPTAGEYQVKAAFLFNFAKFVEWPPSSFSDAIAPLRICVFGQDPFGQELRDIANDKTINGRKLQVNQVSDLRVARTCHILFIASSDTAQVKQALESLRGTGALTVGDSKGFVEQGGMINFVLENERVRFEVNHKAATAAGLKVSSKLLNVAKSVIE